MKKFFATTTVATTLFLATAALPAVAQQPAAPQPAAQQAPYGAEKILAAARCLKAAGLKQGPVEQVKLGDAHFAVVEYTTAVGIRRMRIDFHDAVRAGRAPGVDSAVVDRCMKGAVHLNR